MELHEIFSLLMFLFSIIAVYTAWWATKRGLAYSALFAVTFALLLLGLANLVHLLDELLNLGLIENHLDHLLSILAYLVFIWLIRKGVGLKRT